MTDLAEPRCRARLGTVRAKWLLVGAVILFTLGGMVALGSTAGATTSSGPVAQAEQPDAGSIPSPSDSDDEIRLVMAMLIAVAVIALLGTFVYWVRVGDNPRRGRADSSDSPEADDTLG